MRQRRIEDPAISEQVLHILVSLSRGPLHGYGIIRDIEERTGGRIVLGSGTLYSAIKRMVAAKWVKETQVDDPEDPRRRYYRLTAAGTEVVRAEVRRLEDLLRHARASARLVGANSR
jgi:DNA-binding PadR family transcriptional regulator